MAGFPPSPPTETAATTTTQSWSNPIVAYCIFYTILLKSMRQTDPSLAPPSRGTLNPELGTMTALIALNGRPLLRQQKRPRVESSKDVLVRVEYAGICRTDVYVADGVIKSKPEVVLGHEFAGAIAEIGSAVTNFAIGDRVTANPVMTCTACAGCVQGERCLQSRFLGMEAHGAFADYVLVPQRNLIAVPHGLSMRRAAYTEPIAAALAVVLPELEKDAPGIVYGSNRFARLASQILALRGFTNLHQLPNETAARPEPGTMSFAIETDPSPRPLSALVDSLGYRGTLILKSRSPGSAELPMRAIVEKELTIRAVNYGSFDEAIELLAGGALELDGLFGDEYSLESFETAFARARADEATKLFFRIGRPR